jgi:hypothetical protein
VEILKMEKIEIRSVIKYLHKKGMSPKNIHSDMKEMLGDGAPSYEMVKKWSPEFKCERTTCEDAPMGGSSKSVTIPENVTKVHDVVMADRRKKISEIAEELGLTYYAVQAILSKHLSLHKVTARWVPIMLTPDQKRMCVLYSQSNLEPFCKDPQIFLAQFVTVDETWVHHIDPESKRQSMEWRHQGSPPPRKFKVIPSAGKIMATVFGMQREFC